MNNYLDENAAEIVRRFEQYLSGENPGYFDVEELETISEYYLHKGRIKDSDRAIDVGLRLHPASSELQIKRAKTYLAAGEIHKALSTLERIPNTNDYEAQLLKIEALAKLNRIEEAEMLADHLPDSNESDLDNICLDIAFVFQEQENFQIAEKFLLKGDQINPHNIDLLFELAYCQEELGKIDNAIATYNRILDMDAYRGEAWFNLGQIYCATDQDKALEAYNFCLAIDENDVLAWLYKGHMHFRYQQYAEAIKCYTQCREKGFPESWQTDTFIGECHEKMNDFETAFRFYEKSIQVAPNNYYGYIGIAVCMFEKERYEESIPVLQKAISLRPEAYEVYIYLAEAYSNVERLEESAEAYRKSLEIEPKQADTLMAYGNLLMDMERYQEALDNYLKAKTIDENLEHLNLMLAAAYAKLEDYENAFGCLDMATAQNPKAIDMFFEICPEISELILNLLSKITDKDNTND